MRNPSRVIGLQQAGDYRDGSGVLLTTYRERKAAVKISGPPSVLLDTHFSSARLRHYRTECGGDEKRAEQLYQWNSRISAAFLVDICHVEVALRNTIDRRMSQLHKTAGHSGTWLDDPTQKLGRDKGKNPGQHVSPYSQIAEARRRVSSNKKPLSPGQILSETPFGTWRQMVSNKQMWLWPDLVAAFPHMPGRSQTTVQDLVVGVGDLRNRIGHHHRIWTRDLPKAHRDLLKLAGFIDPKLSTWVSTASTVPVVLAARP